MCGATEPTSVAVDQALRFGSRTGDAIGLHIIRSTGKRTSPMQNYFDLPPQSLRSPRFDVCLFVVNFYIIESDDYLFTLKE